MAGSRSAFKSEREVLLQIKDNNNDQCFKRGIMTPSNALNTHNSVDLDSREWVMRCYILFVKTQLTMPSTMDQNEIRRYDTAALRYDQKIKRTYRLYMYTSQKSR